MSAWRGEADTVGCKSHSLERLNFANHRGRFLCSIRAAVGFQPHSPEQDYCYKFRDRWISVPLPPPCRIRPVPTRWYWSLSRCSCKAASATFKPGHHPGIGTISTIDDIRTYRPFVDGLRAVAILTVVASHVGVPFLAGGYIGVDIFFVISGYLIIGQIEADIERRRFSFVDFAARRALRILPPFLLVMVATLALASTVFVQFKYDDFSDAFFQSALMFANHYFFAKQGYFEMAAFTKPLLHMWSLSVEEQFYLVAPAALVLLYAATRRMPAPSAQRARAIVAAAMALASFAACIIFTYGVSHNAAFYFMPTRGWEFIVGGNAAAMVPVLRRCSVRTLDAIALCGVAAIAFAVVTFDAATPYPTFRAAFPVAGAAAIIACGIAAPHNVVARVLVTRPMVAVGLVSYGWYLWHWPLLSFMRTSDFAGADIWRALAVAGLSFVLAVLTYRLVERPLRAWRQRRRPRSGWVTASMIAASLVIGSGGYVWSRYEAPRFLPAVTGLQPLAASADYPPVGHRGMLLGDSHAVFLAPPLEDFARRAGAELISKTNNGCPPLIHIDLIDPFGERLVICKDLFSTIDFSGTEFIILFARWNFYLGLPWSDPFYRPYGLADERADVAPVEPLELMRRGLTALIEEARRAGVRRVLVVGPVPEFPVDAPFCLVRSLRLGLDGCVMDRTSAETRRGPTMDMLRRVASDFEDVRLADPIDVFCTPKTCRPQEGRTLYYFDSNP